MLFLPMYNKPKLAIIGGGISGVTAAYLARSKFDITLYEANSSLGGNNYSSVVEQNIQIPMGVILFPGGGLFKHTLGFAKKFDLNLINTKLQHDFLVDGRKLYSSNLQLFYKLAKQRSLFQDFRDFHYLFRRFGPDIENSDYTIGKWLSLHNRPISADCVRYFLLMHAALYLSIPYQELFEFPVSIIASWWQKYSTPIRSLKNYSSIQYGPQQLISALATNSNATIQCNTKIESVKQYQNGVELYFDDYKQYFDAVIFATRPDELLTILDNPSKTVIQTFSNIRVTEVQSTLHRKSYGAGSDSMTVQLLNYNNKKQVKSTWEQSKFSHKKTTEPYFISIHEPNIQLFRDEDIIESNTFRVAVPTDKTESIQKGIDKLNAEHNRLFFCGAYYHPSFYHEDGIQSAINMSEGLFNFFDAH